MSARAIAVVAAAVLFGFPLALLLELSLHPEGTGLARPTSALLTDASFENYAEALRRMGDFPRLFWNTVFITACSVAGQLFVCSFAGFAFARLRFRGRDALFLAVLATMLVPEHVASVPRFLLFRALGLVDTWYPLILPTVLGGAPFFIFLFRQVFAALGDELGEAARVDGASPLKMYWHVFLPLVRPMLGTVALFTFLATWNDFWAPLLYVLSPEKRTLTLALAGFSRTYSTSVEHLMAASAVVLAPCLIVYFVAQGVFLRAVRVAARKS
ncbi:MAG: carbohydrate ABC transporter permease [Planctomycetota bacterium]